MTDLYTNDILRWTTRIPHAVRLENPQITSVRTSRICGSRITLDAILDDAGAISEVGMEVKACALGQASAAIIGQHMIGLKKEEYLEIRKIFDRMIRDGDVQYPEKWQDLSLLAPVKDHPSRHGSVRLPFECLEEIFETEPKA